MISLYIFLASSLLHLRIQVVAVNVNKLKPNYNWLLTKEFKNTLQESVTYAHFDLGNFYKLSIGLKLTWFYVHWIHRDFVPQTGRCRHHFLTKGAEISEGDLISE